jgi:hypothetical protein
MAAVRILKGRHRSNKMPRIYYGKTTLCKLVTFDVSCKYVLPVDNQPDWNKLFGLGWLPGHHTTSARFAWRWNPDVNRIQLAAYVYHNGVRTVRFLCNAVIGFTYKLSMCVWGGMVLISVVQANCDFTAATVSMELTPTSKWSYALNPFFGGSQPAPQEIIINLRNV